MMVQIKPNTKSKIEDEYLKFIFESPETNADEALHEYLKDNIWIEHFKRAYNEHSPLYNFINNIPDAESVVLKP